MATKQPLPGLPEPQLPQWASAGDTKMNGLPQTFLNKRKARPLKAGGGWLGDDNTTDTPRPAMPVINGANPQGALPAFENNQTSIAADNNIAPDAPVTPDGSGINWNSVAKGVNSIVPFASNIANAFRRVPQPIRPGTISPVSLTRVSNANERANLDYQTRGEDLAADRSLAGNTGSAVRAAGLATKLRAYGDSYSRENNANADIANRQAEINSGIQERNVASQNNYNDQLVGAKMAQQRQSAANISNASDKYIQIQNATAQRNLDQQKWTDMSRLFSKGIVDRYEDYAKDPQGYMKKIQAQISANSPKTKVSSSADPENEDNDNQKKMGGKLNPSNKSNLKRLRKAY